MSTQPSRGGEREGKREAIADVARRKREHFEQASGGRIRMTQEQAERSVRNNWLDAQKRAGKE